MAQIRSFTKIRLSWDMSRSPRSCQSPRNKTQVLRFLFNLQADWERFAEDLLLLGDIQVSALTY